MWTIIGLTGPEGSGKTTLARALAERHGYEVVSFAAPIKDMMLALGVPPSHIYGPQALKDEPLAMLCGKSARHAMRALGTEWGRTQIGDDIWVTLWKRRAIGRMVVADDVRFHNEVAAVRALGGVVARIIGRGVDGGQHASDRSSELPTDLTVDNSGDMDAFLRNAELALRIP